MNEELAELVQKLEGAFQDRLVSVVLYGSAAAGEHDRGFSDVNVLCVLKQITPRELGDGEPVLHWWRAKGNPSPLLMSESEIFESADSFPMEFRDMKTRRQVLYGPDVIADLEVDTRNHRVLLEHELRTKLLRLRQHGARVLSDPEALLALCLDSVSTFCVLARHALLASGIEPAPGRRGVLRQLAEAIPADMTALETLVDLRAARPEADGSEPVELFARYLASVQALVRYVDELDSQNRRAEAS